VDVKQEVDSKSMVLNELAVPGIYYYSCFDKYSKMFKV
jgi:hypothetical protein